MAYPPVLSKRDFVRRYAAGEFGNHSPTWNTLEELQLSNYTGRLHLRNRHKPGGKGMYNLQMREAVLLWAVMANRDEFYCSGMAPHDKGTLQGELMLTERGPYLLYNLQKVPMRNGFAVEQRHAYGLRALSIIKTYLCPNSYEWLQILLERYPGHCVEFSSFSVNWGTLPNYNTCFWEVRSY